MWNYFRNTGADPGHSKGEGLSRGIQGHAPPVIFEICVSKMAISSSILRQISFSFNTNFLLVNFAFVKKKSSKKGEGEGGGGEQARI